MSYSPSKTDGARHGVVVTTTGAYSVDFEAAYAARKYDQRQGRAPDADQTSRSRSKSPGYAPRDVSREALIQNCENKFMRERSKSGERVGFAAGSTASQYANTSSKEGPMPRARVPVPSGTADYPDFPQRPLEPNHAPYGGVSKRQSAYEQSR